MHVRTYAAYDEIVCRQLDYCSYALGVLIAYNAIHFAQQANIALTVTTTPGLKCLAYAFYCGLLFVMIGFTEITSVTYMYHVVQVSKSMRIL